MKSFDVVAAFETAVAEFAGARYGVAVNTGTSAIFLSLKYCAEREGRKRVTIPARTFISVPMQAIHAGLDIEFEDVGWKGVYQIKPYPVFDGAVRFRRGMYEGGLHCLSFQARKLLNIGEGGMVLTNDADAADWIRRARYSGRGAPTYRIEDVDMIGWQMYMTPEKAARGLHLMEYVKERARDQVNEYPDLREVKAFEPYRTVSNRTLRVA